MSGTDTVKEKLWDCKRRRLEPKRIKIPYVIFNELLQENNDVLVSYTGPKEHPHFVYSIYGVEIKIEMEKSWADGITVEV